MQYTVRKIGCRHTNAENLQRRLKYLILLNKKKTNILEIQIFETGLHKF